MEMRHGLHLGPKFKLRVCLLERNLTWTFFKMFDISKWSQIYAFPDSYKMIILTVAACEIG